MWSHHPSLAARTARTPSSGRRLFALALTAAALTPAAASAQSWPAAPIDLEGFVVTADRVAREAWTISSHTTVIDREALESSGIRYVADVLRSAPGVALVRNGSFGATTSLFLRGGESDHAQVLVDGVPVNEPGGAFDLGSLTTADVERIEVVRGPASALYGSDAMSGVIQIFTRRGTGPASGTLAVRGGSYGTMDLEGSVSGGSSTVSWAASASRTDTDGILAFNNRHLATTVGGRVALALDPRTDAAVSVRYQDREFHFPTDGTGAVVDRNAFTFGDGLTVNLRGSRAWSDRVTTDVSFSTHELDTGTDDAPDGPADSLGFFGFQSLNRTSRRTGDVRARLVVSDGLAVAAGYELERQEIRSTSESLSEFGSTPGSSDHRRWNRAAYGQVLGEWSRLALSAGLRLEDNERFGTAATYRAGLTLRNPASGTRLRAAAGTGIKEPTFFENFATGFTVGNPDLEPERSRSIELGVDQEVGDWPLTASATVFDQRFHDLIQYASPAPVEGGPNYHNLAEASSRGVELTAVLSLGRIDVNGAYTWLDTEVLDAGADEGPGATFVDGERLLRRPAHTLSAAVRAASSDMTSLGLRVRRVGDRSDRDFSAFPAAPVTLDAYTAVDLSGELRLGGGSDGGTSVILSGTLENAFDQRYEEVLGFPAPGRAFYLGASLTLGGP